MPTGGRDVGRKTLPLAGILAPAALLLPLAAAPTVAADVTPQVTTDPAAGSVVTLATPAVTVSESPPTISYSAQPVINNTGFHSPAGYAAPRRTPASWGIRRCGYSRSCRRRISKPRPGRAPRPRRLGPRPRTPR